MNNPVLSPVVILIPDITECGTASLAMLAAAVRNINENRPSKAIKFTKSIIAYATDKFYAYPYQDVPRCWRRIYVDASLVQSIARDVIGEYEAIVHTIDMALIMAGGEGRHKEIKHVLGWLETAFTKNYIDVPEKFPIVEPTVPLQFSIPRVPAPSLESFQNHINDFHTPLILTGALSHWKALQNWNSPKYFLQQTLNGTRLVPIELGESYVADSWTQKLISFSTFMNDHLLKQSTPKGYLAQHDLFSQIPSLRSDIAIPDYCFTIPPENPPDDPQVPYIATDEVKENIWMGPMGTKSPLHNDPYENIFAQVVGYKYFRLFPPKMTEKVYPRGIEGGIQMGNTSQVCSSTG